MSDEHQVNSLDNFLSIPEEDGGNSQVYLPQPASRQQGFGDDQQWRSGVSDGRVVVGTENPFPSTPAHLQLRSTPVVPSSVSGLSTAGPAFPGPVPSPRGNGVLGPHRLAYPGPQQELSGPPTPHSPVAEEFWPDQGFPGSRPVEESAGTSTDVTEAENDVPVDNNVIDDTNGPPEENPPINEEESFISVHNKLRDENRELKTWRNCIVCLTGEKDVAILPCGHVAVCGSCVSGLRRKCPMCRGLIEQTVRIQLSNFVNAGGRQPEESVVV